MISRVPYILTLACTLIAVHAGPCVGQAGGPYRIERSTIDGGGATLATGGPYSAGVTIGQPDAASTSGATYMVGGGFWGGGALVAAPTPTLTLTPSPSRTASNLPSPTRTATAPATSSPTRTTSVPPLATNTPSRTVVASVTPTTAPTPTTTTGGTATATSSPTPTTTPPTTTCAGDCDVSGAVSVDELVRGVNIALERANISLCPAINSNGDQRVTVDELVRAVGAALGGCDGG